MPEGTKPLLSQGYHILHPTASWRKYRRREHTREHVAETFFEDWETFKGYEREFFEESGIVEIVMNALEEVPDNKVVFDTHRGVCARVYSLIRTQQPDTVLATGVYSGVATASMLLALAANDHGRLYSVDNAIELPQEDTADHESLAYLERGRPSCSEGRSHALPADKDAGWIIPDELRDRWSVHRGHCHEVLPDLCQDLEDVGLFYQDGGHSASRMLFEFELAWDTLAPGGLLISPHIDRNDAFDLFIDERACQHGLLEYDYLAYSEYDRPCSCGYVVKPH